MLYLENAPLWVVSKSLTQCKRNKLNPIIQSWENIQYVVGLAVYGPCQNIPITFKVLDDFTEWVIGLS